MGREATPLLGRPWPKDTALAGLQHHSSPSLQSCWHSTPTCRGLALPAVVSPVSTLPALGGTPTPRNSSGSTACAHVHTRTLHTYTTHAHTCTHVHYTRTLHTHVRTYATRTHMHMCTYIRYTRTCAHVHTHKLHTYTTHTHVHMCTHTLACTCTHSHTGRRRPRLLDGSHWFLVSGGMKALTAAWPGSQGGLGGKGPLKVPWPSPCSEQGYLHQTRLLRAPSSLALSVSRDGTPKCPLPFQAAHTSTSLP